MRNMFFWWNSHFQSIKNVYVQNASGKIVFKEVLKYTKKLNFTKCLKVESNRENLVFRGETNFQVNFWMSGDCPISGTSLARVWLAREFSEIRTWKHVRIRTAKVRIQTFFCCWYFLGEDTLNQFFTSTNIRNVSFFGIQILRKHTLRNVHEKFLVKLCHWWRALLSVVLQQLQRVAQKSPNFEQEPWKITEYGKLPKPVLPIEKFKDARPSLG